MIWNQYVLGTIMYPTKSYEGPLYDGLSFLYNNKQIYKFSEPDKYLISPLV